MSDADFDVLVIGTEPPCPRCDLLAMRVEKVAAELGTPITVRHCSYESPEAAAVARGANKRVGTAKEVAREAGVLINWDAVYGLIDERRKAGEPSGRPADAWSTELDAMLDPCRVAAERVGFLMTPVLVVNGSIKHQGSVPSEEQIMAWLLAQRHDER